MSGFSDVSLKGLPTYWVTSKDLQIDILTLLG